MPDPTPPPLVTTAVLARRLSVSSSAIAKWHRAGLITPEFVTPGGHPRWDPDRVRQQLRDQRKRDE
ncbi:MAG: MerR family transcriptional regulator [Pseudonocardiales bacterium]